MPRLCCFRKRRGSARHQALRGPPRPAWERPLGFRSETAAATRWGPEVGPTPPQALAPARGVGRGSLFPSLRGPYSRVCEVPIPEPARSLAAPGRWGDGCDAGDRAGGSAVAWPTPLPGRPPRAGGRAAAEPGTTGLRVALGVLISSLKFRRRVASLDRRGLGAGPASPGPAGSCPALRACTHSATLEP